MTKAVKCIHLMHLHEWLLAKQIRGLPESACSQEPHINLKRILATNNNFTKQQSTKTMLRKKGMASAFWVEGGAWPSGLRGHSRANTRRSSCDERGTEWAGRGCGLGRVRKAGQCTRSTARYPERVNLFATRFTWSGSTRGAVLGAREANPCARVDLSDTGSRVASQLSVVRCVKLS